MKKRERPAVGDIVLKGQRRPVTLILSFPLLNSPEFFYLVSLPVTITCISKVYLPLYMEEYDVYKITPLVLSIP